MIADVITKNGYYQVLNERGQKIAEKSECLCLENCIGFTDRFLQFHKGYYFATYDESFRKISVVSENSVGVFKGL